jgi:hypothetical protein
MFGGGGGGSRPPSGPHVFGLPADAGRPTCEFKGKITYQPEGSAPSADIGAIVLMWPVEPPSKVIQLTSEKVFEAANTKQQSPFNDQLIVAKADDDGNFHLRANEYPEYYVMILSQRSQTTRPKTWGEAMDALKSQLEDPPGVVGQRNYHFTKVPAPDSKVGTLDHTFTE